jgi:D-alanyl-D-alanine carboxypeptidase
LSAYRGIVVRTVFGSTSRKLAQILAAVFIITALAPATAVANSKYAGIVIDAKTGKVLYSNSADSARYPASLTKMMTLYLTFEALEQGKISKGSRVRFSRHAASMQPSKLGVKAGSSISVEQAIYALVTKSANDAAAALAETLGGTESRFAEMMTAKARSLGMKSTTFRNASGLPDSRQKTTARDMATLGIALREHFPQYYGYFSTRSFKFGSKSYGNHNRLLGRVKGVDGIKTGYTRASGFNLVSSVESGGRSIVAVVMGGRTGKSRNDQMVSLIQRYLPKASTGRDRILVAKGPASRVLASVFELPKKGPVPAARPNVLAYAAEETNERIAVAYATADTGSMDNDDAIASRLIEIGAARLPVPAPNPAGEMDRSPRDSVVTAAVRPVSVVGSAPARPVNDPAPGWQIQIGAMPDHDSALSRLELARGKAPGLLASVENYTMMIEKNGTRLYRARFAGFPSKDAAWGACKALKKQRIDCLALQN